MKHYIIVKFIEGYNYIEEINNIKELFNESLKLDGVSRIDIYKSNSSRSNRKEKFIHHI